MGDWPTNEILDLLKFFETPQTFFELEEADDDIIGFYVIVQLLMQAVELQRDKVRGQNWKKGQVALGRLIMVSEGSRTQAEYLFEDWGEMWQCQLEPVDITHVE